METIVIPGGTGFIGFHLAKRAIKKNYVVYSISKKPPVKERYLKKVKYLYYDLSKKNTYIKEIKRCDYVINCSGYGEHNIHKNYKKKFYNNHFQSLKNLVKIFSSNKLKKFIQLGTSLEYSPSKKKLSEKFICKPVSIYGKAKLACTKFLMGLYKKKKFPVVVLRVFQTYGPYQDVNRLIPYVIKKCKKNIKFSCTDGEQERDFIYIDDLVEIILESVNSKKFNGKLFNVGSGESIKIKDLILLLQKKIKKGIPIFGLKKMHSGESEKIIPNLSKQKKYFKSALKYNLKKGINELLKKKYA